MEGQNSGVGTELKINICMDPIDGYHLSGVDFTARVFSTHTTKSVTVRKEEALRIDDDNYLVIIDSGKIGSGRYFLTLTAWIPDNDCADGFRTEVATADTGITVSK